MEWMGVCGTMHMEGRMEWVGEWSGCMGVCGTVEGRREWVGLWRRPGGERWVEVQCTHL